jgi:uncharacterized protein YgbK (DUF1537 family)
VDAIRPGITQTLLAQLTMVRNGQVVAVDAADDSDLRGFVLSVLAAEQAGPHLIYRVGPSFAAPASGKTATPPIGDDTLASLLRPGTHGLVVAGSHVAQTTRQLARLAQRRQVAVVEIDVPTVLDSARLDRGRMA